MYTYNYKSSKQIVKLSSKRLTKNRHNRVKVPSTSSLARLERVHKPYLRACTSPLLKS